MTAQIRPDDKSSTENRGRYLPMARWLVRQHSIKQRMFGGQIPKWSEPIWVMLLHIYMAEEEGKEVSSTSVCLTPDIPVSSAMRYLFQLCSDGLVERRVDKRDGRRTLVSLSPKLREEMQFCLERLWTDPSFQFQA